MPELKHLGLLRDYLSVFNFKRAQKLMSLDDDQLWAFVNENQSVIKKRLKVMRYPKTGFLYGYPHGEDHFRKLFFRDLEEYREYTVNMLIHDFCLGHQQVVLGYWGKSGYLDDADSCDAVKSAGFMPEYNERDDSGFQELSFELLEINQVDKIIASLKANIDNLQINTPTDISRIEKIRNFCLKHDGFKIAYVYDL